MMAAETAQTKHLTVLKAGMAELFAPESQGAVIDATLGMGGHSEAILSRCPDVRILGIDQDQAALELASSRLRGFGDRFTARQGNFERIASIGDDLEQAVIGIIADLGVSSLQLDDPARGFSFRFDAPLDMRMNPDSGGETAAELLESRSESEIADIIYQYGEERASRKIARWIVQRRSEGNPVMTTTQLAELVARAIGKEKRDRIHPATRTFQALRIAVNREMEVLETFLADSVDLLAPEGMLAVITFHSLEDRIVKRAFQRLTGKCECPPRQPVCTCGARKVVELLFRKPRTPTESEIEENPRARSAKLRAVRKLAN